MTDSNRFLWLFMIGATAMLVMKLVLSVPQVFVTLPPVLLMLLYFSQLSRGHHASNRPERAGDNIYYLGFLFTLVSLGLALFEFGLDADNKGGLIADFAVALTTTILGVLFRVWLTQGDKEIDEYEREARLHISEAIDELKSDLKRSSEVLAEFASVTRQTLEENRDEQRKQMEQDREAFEAHFKDTLETMGEVLSGAVTEGSAKLSAELERLASNISAQVGVFTQNVETLNTASHTLSTSLAAAVSAFQAMPDPEALLEEKVQGIVRPLEMASAQMVGVLDKQSSWAEQSAASVERVVGSLTTLNTTVATLSLESSQSLAKIHGPIDTVVQRLQVVEAALATIARQTEGLQAFTGGLEQLPQRLARSMGGIDGLGRAIGEATEKLSGALNTLYRDIEMARSSQIDALSEDAVKLRQLSADRQALLSAVSTTNEQLQLQIDQLRDQLGGMSDALVGAAKFIRAEVSALA